MRRDVLLLAEGDYSGLRSRLEATIQSVDPEARVRDLSGYSYEYFSPHEALRRELGYCLLAVARSDSYPDLRRILDRDEFPWVFLRAGEPKTWGEKQSGGFFEADPAAFEHIRDRYEQSRLAQRTAPLAFISYVREDAPAVDQLCRLLRRRGVRTWRDRDDLLPGERWKDIIREAIQSRAIAFVACFSEAYSARSRTYMNEELVLAVEEARLRPRDRAWLFPVRLDASAVPPIPLGAGETLADIQSLPWFDDPHGQTNRLASAILRQHEEALP